MIPAICPFCDLPTVKNDISISHTIYTCNRVHAHYFSYEAKYNETLFVLNINSDIIGLGYSGYSFNNDIIPPFNLQDIYPTFLRYSNLKAFS